MGKFFCGRNQIAPTPPKRRLACLPMNDSLAFRRQPGVTKPLPPDGFFESYRKMIARDHLGISSELEVDKGLRLAVEHDDSNDHRGKDDRLQNVLDDLPGSPPDDEIMADSLQSGQCRHAS